MNNLRGKNSNLISVCSVYPTIFAATSFPNRMSVSTGKIHSPAVVGSFYRAFKSTLYYTVISSRCTSLHRIDSPSTCHTDSSSLFRLPKKIISEGHGNSVYSGTSAHEFCSSVGYIGSVVRYCWLIPTLAVVRLHLPSVDAVPPKILNSLRHNHIALFFCPLLSSRDSVLYVIAIHYETCSETGALAAVNFGPVPGGSINEMGCPEKLRPIVIISCH